MIYMKKCCDPSPATAIKRISSQKYLNTIFEHLFAKFGPQSWWPAKTPFEIIVGAILTQNTNWKNVEKAIINLGQANLLSPMALKKTSLSKLAAAIKPAGYFNVKAGRIKNFVDFLFEEYGGRLDLMKKENLKILRPKLLSVNGIGPETADSILLYALEKPIFVVDNYTKRILLRHSLIEPQADYHAIQAKFMRELKADIQLFNEYHALIVQLGKDICKTKPECERCPINHINYSIDFNCHFCRKALPRPQDRFHPLASRDLCSCLSCRDEFKKASVIK